MSALTRLERFDDLFPEFFRRFGRPLALADEAPGDILTSNQREVAMLEETL